MTAEVIALPRRRPSLTIVALRAVSAVLAVEERYRGTPKEAAAARNLGSLAHLLEATAKGILPVTDDDVLRIDDFLTIE